MSKQEIIRKQTLFGQIRKLNHIKRCALFPTVNTTSVAEHSFQVVVMAHLLAEQISAAGCPIKVSEVTNLALFHDMEETCTSDIPWPVKRVLRNGSEFDDLVEDLVFQELQQYSPYLASASSQSCDGSLEWLVVKICDIGELLAYCKEEYDMGNRHMYEMIGNSVIELKRLLKKFSDKIQDIVNNLPGVLDSGWPIRRAIGVSAVISELQRLIHWASKFEE